jgi:hypothetical protein
MTEAPEDGGRDQPATSPDDEAPEADALEQHIPISSDDEVLPRDLPGEADEADAAEQSVPVPLDEDDYRT